MQENRRQRLRQATLQAHENNGNNVENKSRNYKQEEGGKSQSWLPSINLDKLTEPKASPEFCYLKLSLDFK